MCNGLWILKNGKRGIKYQFSIKASFNDEDMLKIFVTYGLIKSSTYGSETVRKRWN